MKLPDHAVIVLFLRSGKAPDHQAASPSRTCCSRPPMSPAEEFIVRIPSGEPLPIRVHAEIISFF